MLYFITPFIVLLLLWFCSWVFKRKNRYKDEPNNEFTPEQHLYFRGRKTEHDWKSWYNDIMNNSKN